MTDAIFSPLTRNLPAARRRPLRALATALTVGVTALSLMVASALPARADKAGDDLAKAIVAAIAIGAIVNSIDNKRKDSRPAPLPSHGSIAPRIPRDCAIEIAGKRRSVTVYPERCLRRERVEGRLPRNCAFNARIYGRVDRVYAEDCLRDAGYRVGGRGVGHRDDRHDRRHDRDWHY